MHEPVKVVAVLAANPALSSILTAMIAAMPGLRVRGFESQIALSTYMRLSAVDLLVCDFDSEAAPAGSLARALRADPNVARRDFQVIALASMVTDNMKQASITSGIDEVVIKPMSPKYLLERVLSRLKRATLPSPGYQGPERRLAVGDAPRVPPRYSDNVVPLFRDRHVPLH